MLLLLLLLLYVVVVVVVDDDDDDDVVVVNFVCYCCCCCCTLLMMMLMMMIEQQLYKCNIFYTITKTIQMGGCYIKSYSPYKQQYLSTNKSKIQVQSSVNFYQTSINLLSNFYQFLTSRGKFILICGLLPYFFAQPCNFAKWLGFLNIL